jgi:uncharacterized protein YggE
MRALILMMFIAAMPLGAVTPAAAQAQSERSVTVHGDASVNVVPDRATISVGVSSRGKTARDASEANNKAMEKVLAALREGGISERDIRTEYLSLQPLHEDGRGGNVRIVGFQASNSVRITLRDIGQVGAVLDRLIAAGANEISGIQFDVSDRSKRLDGARAEAVADAKRKAEILAKAAGVRLGRATVIVEDGGRPPVPVMMRAAPAAATPVAPGEQTLQANVTVSFELMH